jgi:hypothetical protein
VFKGYTPKRLKMIASIKHLLLQINDTIPPFDYLVFASIFTALLSLATMNDFIRFVILLVTVIGAIVKVIEQIGASPKTLGLISKLKETWKSKLTKKVK